MNKIVKYAVFACFGIAIAIGAGYNMYLSNQELEQPLASNVTLADMDMLAQGEDNEFPEDPWSGMGDKVNWRTVTNEYIYTHRTSYTDSNGDEWVYQRRVPTTTVDCGRDPGEIACMSGEHSDFSEAEILVKKGGEEYHE